MDYSPNYLTLPASSKVCLADRSCGPFMAKARFMEAHASQNVFWVIEKGTLVTMIEVTAVVKLTGYLIVSRSLDTLLMVCKFCGAEQGAEMSDARDTAG
jgi:hypothetical protein